MHTLTEVQNKKVQAIMMKDNITCTLKGGKRE